MFPVIISQTPRRPVNPGRPLLLLILFPSLLFPYLLSSIPRLPSLPRADRRADMTFEAPGDRVYLAKVIRTSLATVSFLFDGLRWR